MPRGVVFLVCVVEMGWVVVCELLSVGWGCCCVVVWLCFVWVWKVGKVFFVLCVRECSGMGGVACEG